MTPFTWMLILLAGVLLVMWLGTMSRLDRAERLLREWVKAHVPCFCLEHGNLIEEAVSTAQAYAHEAPGLLFGAYRRYVAIKRATRVLT